MIMLTLEQKNERAFNLVDYSETPSLQFELLEVFTCEPDWTFYKMDRSLTDDMTAVIASEFAHVHRVEIAHLSLEDHSLHRIFDTN